MRSLFIFSLLFAASAVAADLTPEDKSFLAGYEHVRAALAADDLTAAKKAAPEAGDAKLADAASLAAARQEFADLSAKAVPLAKGQPGYFIVYCPMAKKDWVQTSKSISNPYEGKEMLSCGIVKP